MAELVLELAPAVAAVAGVDAYARSVASASSVALCVRWKARQSSGQLYHTRVAELVVRYFQLTQRRTAAAVERHAECRRAARAIKLLRRFSDASPAANRRQARCVQCLVPRPALALALLLASSLLLSLPSSAPPSLPSSLPLCTAASLPSSSPSPGSCLLALRLNRHGLLARLPALPAHLLRPNRSCVRVRVSSSSAAGSAALSRDRPVHCSMNSASASAPASPMPLKRRPRCRSWTHRPGVHLQAQG